MTPNVATFGAGCFWHVEEAFREQRGVVKTEVGYMGGWKERPTYEEVCSHSTGHAEVCQVTFDPEQVSYDELLERFWQIHDPTQLNRQGPDVGSNYRSVIFFHSPVQKLAAEASKAKEQLQPRYSRPIVTEIIAATTFWPAEEYHQCYLEKRGGGSCHL
ncbi:MAG TPA: peptide-methionine (S)-S-oxide reductase MsrA [Geobacterales bacterium]|nr:peptide-methionine (S)-S-oxide reductase MsrA [Geobacterales bacterium]